MKILEKRHYFNYLLFFMLFLYPYTNAFSVAATTQIKQAELIQIHPSDATLFVQGLELSPQGELFLGTGQYGSSQTGRMNIENGRLEDAQTLESPYFGEGLTVKDDYVWQLTWRENTVFQRDIESLEVVNQFNYEGEGWGLAYDEDRDIFWMTDGSSTLQIRNSENFELIDEIEVTLIEQALSHLNELEYAHGLVWANVWYQNFIVAIDPETGVVVNYYDVGSILDELGLSDEERQEMDSLNGIAHIEGDRFFITGKLYPVIMEVILPQN